MTESIAREQLVSIFARWRILEETKAAISEDSKELFAEAKGNGYDPKALRLAFRAKVKADEADPADAELQALVEIYVEALGTPIAIARIPREPRNAPRPSNRDVSTGGRPFRSVGPAGQAEQRQGPPAGHEGHISEGERAPDETASAKPGGELSPVDLEIPAILRRAS